MDPFVRALLAQPDLGREAERELAVRARAGDAEARDRLIRGALRLVALRARMLGFGRDDLADAVQAGSLGLIRAVDRFDPDSGVRLATFAWWWIGEAMREAVPPPVELVPEPPDRPQGTSGGVDLAELDDLPEVLRLRYRIGEDPGPPRTRAEVGRLLEMTPGQVRGAEEQAMRRVRARLAKIVHRAPRRGADPP